MMDIWTFGHLLRVQHTYESVLLVANVQMSKCPNVHDEIRPSVYFLKIPKKMCEFTRSNCYFFTSNGPGHILYRHKSN